MSILSGMLDNVIQWSNVNSGSYNALGLERMAAVLSQAFSALECEGNIYSLPPIEEVDKQGERKKVDLGPLLNFRKRPDAPVQVLLVGHMDTVYGLEHPFQTAVRKGDNILLGPGVTDMKGGLCVMLHALKLFEETKDAQMLGWEVLINPDEEIGSPGSAPFLAERAKKHQVGLLFEPAMDEAGTLAGARKGSGNFAVQVKGRASHAGRDFHLGRNAISALARIVAEIDALNGQKEGVTINVGHIEGGDAINIVPEDAICRLDVRTLEKEDEAWVKDHLDAIITKAHQQEGITAKLSGFFTRKPKVLSPKMMKLYELVMDVAKGLNQHISFKPSGGCCDGNNLADAGLSNVDTLGVCGGRIHSVEEYLLIDSLEKRARLSAAILTRLSVQGFGD